MQLDSKNDGIIFLPGWGFHASVMKPVASHFPDYPIHYADLPFIENNNETFDSLVSKLNKTLPNDATLIAWSLGGLFAIALCAAFPEKYTQLILLASTPRFLEDRDWKGISAAQANTFLTMAKTDLSHLIKHFHRLICYPSKDASLREHLKSHALSHEPSLRFYLNLLFEVDLREPFKSLKQDVNQIAGEKDAIVSANNPDQLIAGAGHVLF